MTATNCTLAVLRREMNGNGHAFGLMVPIRIISRGKIGSVSTKKVNSDRAALISLLIKLEFPQNAD